MAEAQARVLSAARVGPTEQVPILDSLGRALAEDLVAAATLPPWDNSAMDGYAVRGEDVTGASEGSPVRLKVTGRTRAGEPALGTVRRGEAVRIMTGAPIPEGCDSVIRVEDTDAEREPGFVVIRSDRDRHRNVRPRGEDMAEGDRLCGKGSTVTTGVVGLLAALGRSQVFVHRRPTVAILTTGDELRGPDRFHEVRSAGGIPDSNGPLLAAAARAAGALPLSLGPVPDEPEAMEKAVERGGNTSVLVLVGGASVGEADLAQRVLEGLGFRRDFWRVRMRPGSPFAFGSLPTEGGLRPVFILPGNPASAFVTFELFVRPFLLRLAGHQRVDRRRVAGVVATRMQGAGNLTLFPRVTVHLQHGRLLVSSPGPQSSGLVRGLSLAEGLAVIPEGVDAVEKGQEVEVILLGDPPGGEPWEGP